MTANQNQPDECRERTLLQIEAEAQALRLEAKRRYNFVSIESARNRVAEYWGWVNYEHCVQCKQKRNAP